MQLYSGKSQLWWQCVLGLQAGSHNCAVRVSLSVPGCLAAWLLLSIRTCCSLTYLRDLYSPWELLPAVFHQRDRMLSKVRGN